LVSYEKTLPKLGEEIVEQIEAAWKLPQPDWARTLSKAFFISLALSSS
jgi:hypothetical protein